MAKIQDAFRIFECEIDNLVQRQIDIRNMGGAKEITVAGATNLGCGHLAKRIAVSTDRISSST
jgi:hypothetical protein